jgi:hypothetical protein
MKIKSSLLKAAIAFFIPAALFATAGCQSTRNQAATDAAELKTVTDENARMVSELTRAREDDIRTMNELKAAIEENTARTVKTQETCSNAARKLEQENQSLRQELNALSGEIRKTPGQAPRDTAGGAVKVSGDATRLDNGKMIFGNQEWVYIAEADASFASRIDTGASVSSINAANIEKVEKDGKVWYNFDIPLDDGNVIHLSAPRVRTAVIIQASSDRPEERPVVKLTVKIGSYTGVNEFSLKNRDKMQFPLLVGREFIQDIAVVDVSRENVQKKIESSVTVEAYKDAGVNNREKNSSGRNNKKDKAAKDGSAPQQEQQKELKEKQKETQQVLAHPKEDLPEGADGSEGSPDAGSGLQ